MPLEIATGLYRITQEALRNVSKHAGKTHTRVTLRGTGKTVQLQVADFGHGFNMSESRTGLGLLSMEERTRHIGGLMEVRSAPGRRHKNNGDCTRAGPCGTEILIECHHDHDVIVIGASAGGIEALQELVGGLPADLAAALFVVMHVPPRAKSLLPDILSRSGSLQAAHAVDGEPIEHHRIYVAPPDHHLVIERGHVHLTCGPKEQHHRPCINVTFRSAAAAYEDRVVGVVLSGELDDGTAGLWEIERRGGVTVVQNPEEAAFPSMPLSALREIEVHHTVGIREMGALLTRLRSERSQAAMPAVVGDGHVEHKNSHLTDLTCPECRGTIWEVTRGKAKDYRCRVGHTYSAKSMLASHFAAQEKALYAAIVALEEGASLATLLSREFSDEYGERLRTEAQEREAQASAIRRLLKDRRSFEIE